MKLTEMCTNNGQSGQNLIIMRLCVLSCMHTPLSTQKYLICLLHDIYSLVEFEIKLYRSGFFLEIKRGMDKKCAEGCILK